MSGGKPNVYVCIDSLPFLVVIFFKHAAFIFFILMKISDNETCTSRRSMSIAMTALYFNKVKWEEPLPVSSVILQIVIRHAM